MSDAAMQEHERTVSQARLGMAFHDSHKSLQRWFENYRDNKSEWFGYGWCVVTRDGLRWKIEFGYVEEQEPSRTVYADPRAPQPPVFEFRPPKPEPVKHRQNVPDFQRVPSLVRGEMSYHTVMAMAQMAEAALRPMRDDFYRRATDRWRLFDRPTFDRVAAPPPPPPTRRNQ